MIIRGEGPKGGPGMPEMLTPTSAIMGAGLGKVWCPNSKFVFKFVKICCQSHVMVTKMIVYPLKSTSSLHCL